MNTLKIIKIFKETISDGPGFRYSIYFSGCNHFCKGCHNPETWKGNIGEEVDENYMQQIISDINNNPLLDGITLSGGDPFFNPTELLVFLKRLKAEVHMDIWVYTGYTFEVLMKDDTKKECLEYIDTLVDGKFEDANANPELFYRGSSNQRIINVVDSFEKNEIIERNFD